MSFVSERQNLGGVGECVVGERTMWENKMGFQCNCWLKITENLDKQQFLVQILLDGQDSQNKNCSVN